MILSRRTVLMGSLALPFLHGTARAEPVDVRRAGAKGDGRSLDHHAINAVIADAAKKGGGIVVLPAGRYLCFSIRLRSNIALLLEPGAVIVAADPAQDGGSYDPPEPNAHDIYQDFGHSHWQNSLIWGDGLENVAIMGGGLIDGTRGLTRQGPGARWQGGVGSGPNSMGPSPARPAEEMEAAIARMAGLGNKAIALKNCRNVLLRDFRMLNAGHFALLASGVRQMTIDNLLVDTNRDGLDIDACRDVTISNCRVNTPNDDAIVLKSSAALAEIQPTENVAISDCIVSGFDPGTVLDGTYGRTQALAPDRDGMTGRIKLGTESTGGFRNVAITNCVFERSRGLALESVDGGVLENVTVSNLTMREVTTAPIFLRLGDRRRAPPGAGVAQLRGVTISNVEATDIDPAFAATIAGLPDAPVEDVHLSGIRLRYRGGGTKADAERAVPEERATYPEPSMFGTTPAWGLYVRHARGLRIDGLDLSTAMPDARPAVHLEDAHDVSVSGLRAPGEIVRRASSGVRLVPDQTTDQTRPGGA
ncbi:rhamnogalacturonidase [Croceibacterium ferulae]|uniref:rhamnogalacturonidase n=1 Tax=Croceibacterium ferulae TaxID=1854641 RepID=UPI0015882608|nr:glycosyl hydrolase family 28-related protein [Croceibacterium ferulae]